METLTKEHCYGFDVPFIVKAAKMGGVIQFNPLVTETIQDVIADAMVAYKKDNSQGLSLQGWVFNYIKWQIRRYLKPMQRGPKLVGHFVKSGKNEISAQLEDYLKNNINTKEQIISGAEIIAAAAAGGLKNYVVEADGVIRDIITGAMLSYSAKRAQKSSLHDWIIKRIKTLVLPRLRATVAAPVYSLNTPIKACDGNKSLGETLSDGYDVEERAMESSDKDLIRKAIAMLDKKGQFVVNFIMDSMQAGKKRCYVDLGQALADNNMVKYKSTGLDDKKERQRKRSRAQQIAEESLKQLRVNLLSLKEEEASFASAVIPEMNEEARSRIVRTFCSNINKLLKASAAPIPMATIHTAKRFSFENMGLIASGEHARQGFVVFKGSQIAISHSQSAQINLVAQRLRLIQTGKLTVHDKYLEFAEDVEFETVKAAASIIYEK